MMKRLAAQGRHVTNNWMSPKYARRKRKKAGPLLTLPFYKLIYCFSLLLEFPAHACKPDKTEAKKEHGCRFRNRCLVETLYESRC
jgi:hypothetical protein